MLKLVKELSRSVYTLYCVVNFNWFAWLIMGGFPVIEWQYFGLEESQVPLIIIQTNDGKKYLKPNLEADQIASWLKDYKVVSLGFG